MTFLLQKVLLYVLRFPEFTFLIRPVKLYSNLQDFN